MELEVPKQGNLVSLKLVQLGNLYAVVVVSTIEGRVLVDRKSATTVGR